MGRKMKTMTSGPKHGLAHWLFENQTSLSFSIAAGLFTAHTCIPQARPFTSRFITLSGFNPKTGKYAIGHDDLYFVLFCIVLFTGIRAGSMRYILAPFARRWGISKEKTVNRFSEQGWMILYNAVFWTTGMYIYTHSPHYLNLQELWTDWPQRELDGLMKGYILAQWAYWTQQLIVVNIEARRHDYNQMIVHHFTTIALIGSAYAYHHTRVTNLIMVLMDVIELIFPVAKCLKYLGFTTLCDVIFGIFMITWLFTRHIFYMMATWSAYNDSPRLMPSACWKGTQDNLEGPLPVPTSGWSHLFEPFRDPKGTVCMNDNLRIGFVVYLLVLQCVMIVWSAAIVRVAIKVLRGENADDVRSDDEASDEIEEELDVEVIESEKAQLLEEEVGVEAIDFEVWKRRTGVKAGTSRSSGVRVPGHSDRKELLNRIGCEKQID
ncbi:longevity-assurance protein [Xylariaceae sp. FL1272]|nr:longevity-assurance protein [Xylariaceae sp. FL1272]